MTSQTTPAPPDEEEMGSHPSRLVKPFLLAAPLMALALVPAFFYGRHSDRVAADADEALMASLDSAADGPGMTLDPEALCDQANTESIATEFAVLDLVDEAHKASVTGLGFDTVTVDLKGWVESPAAIDPDTRDDISVRMERINDDWCVADVVSLAGQSG